MNHLEPQLTSKFPADSHWTVNPKYGASNRMQMSKCIAHWNTVKYLHKLGINSAHSLLEDTLNLFLFKQLTPIPTDCCLSWSSLRGFSLLVANYNKFHTASWLHHLPATPQNVFIPFLMSQRAIKHGGGKAQLLLRYRASHHAPFEQKQDVLLWGQRDVLEHCFSGLVSWFPVVLKRESFVFSTLWTGDLLYSLQRQTGQ